MTEEIKNKMRQADYYFQLNAIPYSLRYYLQCETLCRDALFTEEFSEAVFACKLYKSIAECYLRLSCFEEAKNYLEKAFRLQNKLFDSQEKTFLSIEIALDNALLYSYSFWDVDYALSWFQKSINTLYSLSEIEITQEHRKLFITVLLALGDYHYLFSSLTEAEESYMKALSLLDTPPYCVCEWYIEYLGKTYKKLGDLEMERNCYDKAKEYYNQTLEYLSFTRLGKNTAHYLVIVDFYSSLAIYYLFSNDFEKSASFSKSGIMLLSALEEYGFNASIAVQKSFFLTYLGNALDASKNNVDALTRYNQALQLLKEVDGAKDNLFTIPAFCNVYRSIGNSSKKDDAIYSYFNELKYAEKLQQKSDNKLSYLLVTEAYFHLGDFHCFRNNFLKARLYYDSFYKYALTLLKYDESSGKIYSFIALALERVGNCFYKQNISENTIQGIKEATAKLLTCIDYRLKAVSLQPNVSIYQRDLAISYMILGEIEAFASNVAEAVFYYKRSAEIIVSLLKSSPNFPLSLELSYIYQSIGKLIDNDKVKQLDYYLHAVDNFEQYLKTNDNKENRSRLIKLYRLIARLYVALGQRTEADIIYNRINDLEK